MHPTVILGYNAVVATTQTDLAEHLASGPLSIPTAGETWEVVSSSANDTAAGSGARTVRVYGLDASYNPLSETVILAGATPVATTNTTWFRVLGFHVLTVGSGGVTAGNVTLRVSGAGATRARITAGSNRAYQAFYTTPAGFRAEVTRVDFGIDTGAAGRGIMLANVDPMDHSPLAAGVFVEQMSRVTNGPAHEDFSKVLFSLPPKTDVKLAAISLGAGTVKMGGQMALTIRRVA